MRHEPDHDPLIDYPRCSVCYSALSVGFSKLADLDLGPRDTNMLINTLRELALSSIGRSA